MAYNKIKAEKRTNLKKSHTKKSERAEKSRLFITKKAVILFQLPLARSVL